MVCPQKVSRASVNTTEARAWLAEVPGAALVQSVNDSRRAWRNFFDSVTGKRAGRKVGRPRFKSRKDQRQSFWLTRNGFSLKANGRLFFPKAGVDLSDPANFASIGMTVTGMPALNAIASVVAARPGIITNADLPPRGFVGRFKLQPVIRKRG